MDTFDNIIISRIATKRLRDFQCEHVDYIIVLNVFEYFVKIFKKKCQLNPVAW